MHDVDERLRGALRAAPPDSVAALPDHDRAALAAVLERARRGQASALEEAFTATLKFVPFPVRKIVKKVLLG